MRQPNDQITKQPDNKLRSFQFSVFGFQCPRSGRGFTLMELMVVVSLVLLIISVGLTNYITQVKRSHDARRKSDLEQIRAALEMYRADNGEYISGGWFKIDGLDALSSALESGGYINDVPVDPLDNGTEVNPCDNERGYRYNYVGIDDAGGNPKSYVLTAIMEKDESSDASPCDSLSNWDAASWCSGSFATVDYCYGVQNP